MAGIRWRYGVGHTQHVKLPGFEQIKRMQTAAHIAFGSVIGVSPMPVQRRTRNGLGEVLDRLPGVLFNQVVEGPIGAVDQAVANMVNLLGRELLKRAIELAPTASATPHASAAA